MKIKRMVFAGKIPDHFFDIAKNAYLSLPFKLQEDAGLVLDLFNLEAEKNEIIIYTSPEDLRLVGIFPKDKNEAYFGFWETVNDLDLNAEAFNLLERDALKRGRKALLGPLNFNTFHNYRLRADLPPWIAFDREPVNPLFYPEMLIKLGFATKSQFESRYVERSRVPDYYANKRKFIEQLDKLPVGIIPLSYQNWEDYEVQIYKFVIETFGNNPAFQIISRKEFQLVYNLSFARKLCPYSSVLFTDKRSGEIAALSFCQPNYQSISHVIKVPVFETHFDKLPVKTLLIKTVGVHPLYRNMNLMSYLGAYAMQSFKEIYDDAIFCLMRSDNVSTNFTRGLPYVSSRYFLFEKKLS